MTSDTSREHLVGDRDLVVADLVAALRRAHRLCDTTSDNLPELSCEALEQEDFSLESSTPTGGSVGEDND